jgi:hypothetical protein
VFAPTAPGNYTFEVTVTNEHGCSSTASVSICVVDVRVPGTNGKKIYICQMPSGNPANTNAIDVSVNAVSSFIYPGSGSQLGVCGIAPCNANRLITQAAKQILQGADAGLEVTVLNNPARDQFVLQIRGDRSRPVEIRLATATGQIMESRTVAAGSRIMLGQRLPSGQYFAEVTQGGQRKVVKLLKL